MKVTREFVSPVFIWENHLLLPDITPADIHNPAALCLIEPSPWLPGLFDGYGGDEPERLSPLLVGL